MHIFVGSTNPVKINAAINAASEAWPEVIVKGFSVGSGVDEQPRSDLETKQGAINRAKAALALGLKGKEISGEVLGMGLEGGIDDLGEEMWTTVWSSVIDREGNLGLSAGSRFLVPVEIADLIRAGGEMGPVTAQILGEKDPTRIKKQQGMVGIITENFVDRTEEYQSIAKLALGMWYGRHWRRAHGLE
ncbi:MAG: inosine/xanthosine triphosphatase [Candidatus Paceibacterota bacterium]